MEIAGVEDLQRLVREGFDDWSALGCIAAKHRGPLVLLAYTKEAQVIGRWNLAERLCRGLIIDSRDGSIVARPFDKFFNWGEREGGTEAPLTHVFEKLDGSLGIFYRDELGAPRVATRGSFESEQAIRATWMLERYDLGGLPSDWTLLFEIVYPENRIVVDYRGRDELVLLGARSRSTGEHVDWPECQELASVVGLGLPKVYDFDSPEAVSASLSELSGNEEGFVGLFADGSRWKFKGDEYRRLHRFATQLTFKAVLDAVREGTVAEAREATPVHLHDQFDRWHDIIRGTVAMVRERVELAFRSAPRETRKEYALWVREHEPALMPYMFARLDDQDVRDIALRKAFETGGPAAGVWQ